ncbi:hypothetical protein OIY81_1724 [Cryptosporidium canis]|nr:hypothetical protein OIY81_1724 [Cryptosporidium canis]
MEIIRNIINIYLKQFLHLEDLKWDMNEGLQVDNVQANSQSINKQFEEKNIPIQLLDGKLDSIRISYSPTNGAFQINIKEINAQVKPRILSTVGKKIQQSIVNIILDEDPVEFIDTYSYIRDLPISYLEQASKKSESCIIDPSLIPEPPKFPTAALKIKQLNGSPPQYYPPLYGYTNRPSAPMLASSTPLPQNRYQEFPPSNSLVYGVRNQSVPISHEMQSPLRPSSVFCYSRESGNVRMLRENGFCI